MTPPGILPGKLFLLRFSCAQIQPQNPLFPFIYFLFLQPNKAGFYLGNATLSAILGITWRL